MKWRSDVGNDVSDSEGMFLKKVVVVMEIGTLAKGNCLEYQLQ